MAIKEAIKEITKVHRYLVTGEFWGRVGVMHKRYGEDTLIEAISKVPSQEIPLKECLNKIEYQCQAIINNEDFDEEVLNMF